MKTVSPTTPMTVIGGFLGAGKTTFLNHLLSAGEKRYAVLVNDFGEINIDAALIARHDGATMMLANGCVCCSTAGGFFETLIRVLENETPFDHIIIEASGVGDPWRIAEIALIEPSLKLDALITVVDTSRIGALLNDPKVADTVRNQLMRCDTILLNKIDLTNDQGIDCARHAICKVRSGAIRIIPMSRNAMPTLEALAPIASQSRFRSEPMLPAIDHEAQFCRWIYQRAGSFDRMRFATAVASLPDKVLRLKGSCRFSDGEMPAVFQMAGKVWSLSSCGDVAFPYDITLVGVGTLDMPPVAELDRILDRALAA